MTTDQQAEFGRLQSYLNTQGERNSHTELWPRVVKARMELLDCLAKVTEEQAAWAPTDDDWSIKEVALHILNSSRSVRRIVLLFRLCHRCRIHRSSWLGGLRCIAALAA